MSSRVHSLAASARCAALLAGALAAGCHYPQRLPGPLVLPEATRSEPAPPASEEYHATVQRDSGPVWVRRAGQRDDYELPFHRKRELLPRGTIVRLGAGGRAQLLWSPDATTIVLFDEARVSIGDPERDEPLVRIVSVTHALLVLTPEDRIELPGGALLQGDASDVSATLLLERDDGGILRVTNQSKHVARVRFREETLEIGSGEALDLPQLTSGSAPREADEPERAAVLGIALSWNGVLQRAAEGNGVRVRATGPARVTALGVVAQLEDQQEARFSGLSQVPTAVPADASAPASPPR